MLRPVAAAALLCLLPGCVAVAAAGVVGVGVVQYQRNEAVQDFPTDLGETWQASLEALRRLGIDAREVELGATEGRIEHEDLTVVVERHPEGFTRVRVRVGAFHTRDHERRANLVLREISASIEQVDGLRDWAEQVKELSKPAQDAPVPE